ncbi:MAG: hypothetical protein N4A76_11480 [Firmicutes bacterium]|jgi:peptidoglycan hydrolase CwlO-like protein|nr:hypothetical protein [Bacillota bacterium]
MLRVIEVANELGVSKVTIYKKMSKFKNELKPFIVKDKNITFIMDEGIEIIKNDLPVMFVSNEHFDSRVYEEEINELKNTTKNLQVEMKNIEVEYRRFLMKVLDEKKKEIKRKQDIVEKLKSIIEENKNRISSLEDVSDLDY